MAEILNQEIAVDARRCLAARPRNPSMAAIAFRDSSASNRRQAWRHAPPPAAALRVRPFGLPPCRDTNRAFARHERIATSLALPVTLQEQNGLGIRQSSRPFHFSTPPPFPVPRIKTVLLLMKQVKSQRETKNFSCAAKAAFVSLRLAEGRRPKWQGGAWRRSQPRVDNRIVE